MSNLDQIRALLDSIEKVGASAASADAIGRAMTDIASSLSAIAVTQEKSELGQMIVQALGNLSVQVPAPVVNVAAAPAPVVNIAPPNITLPEFPAMPAAAPPTGWRMRVVARDDLGRIAELSFKPET